MDRIFVDREERPIRSDILRSFMCWTDHAVRSLTNLVYCFASFFLDIRFHLRFNSPLHMPYYVRTLWNVWLLYHMRYIYVCVIVCVWVYLCVGKENGCLLFFPLPNMNSWFSCCFVIIRMHYYYYFCCFFIRKPALCYSNDICCMYFLLLLLSLSFLFV